jgi:sulfate transport system substrate-binding protein
LFNPVLNTTFRGVAALLITSFVMACGGTPSASRPASSGPAASAGPSQSPAPAASAAPSFNAQPGAVTLVAYSTPREAYDDLVPAFQATDAGSGVEFETSYGASGDQSRAVEAGLPADFVEFSLAPDMDRLVKAGIVAADWNAGQYKGMVTDSVVVFVVRKGNPKNIHNWSDLANEGVGVITPNPFTSGGARWNVMAAYGAMIKQGKSEADATAFLTSMFQHTLVQDKSARDALQTFVAGQGDVMLAYENEAILAQQGGQDIDYVVPDQTILIENPAAVTIKGGDAQTDAKAFLDFLLTPEAQQVFANKGYRPVVAGVTPPAGISFPQPSALFTIEDLGGWSDVTTKFFDKTNGIVAQIERGLGINP